MELKVVNSPFNQEQADLLNRLVPTLNETQKSWLSGYLAALQPAGAEPAAEAEGQDRKHLEARKVTILYGTDTGNSAALAKKLAEKLESESVLIDQVAVFDDFKHKNLKSVQDLLIVTSTHGDGDPPDNALSFHEFLHGKRAPKLDGLRFSVLALGDSSYEFFCQTGKDFDKRLEELGGERLYQRTDCDVDFEEAASAWMSGVLSKIKVDQKKSTASRREQSSNHREQTAYSRQNPFQATVLENISLNGRGSNKETRHLEIDLEGSNLLYEPGDSLGIYPENDPALVDEFIQLMGWDSEEAILVSGENDQLPLRQALISRFEITKLTRPILENLADLVQNKALNTFIHSDPETIQSYIHGRDLIDLAKDFGPFDLSAVEFTSILRKIPVRLYSIASSLKAVPDEVHLTVGKVQYHAHGRERKGVCSGQLAERLAVGDPISVFVQSNQNFRLPENPDTPIIMIGPGTGIAPFRAFLQEREEIEAKGNAWLFFGDQHFVTDFLYQTELQQWLKDGVLTRLDVAFSRDTAKKVYVQHRMLEKSKEIYEWLQAGAHLYVCGDMEHMAKDVHAALVSILQTEAGFSEEAAEDYLSNLRKEKRYQRDVY